MTGTSISLWHEKGSENHLTIKCIKTIIWPLVQLHSRKPLEKELTSVYGCYLNFRTTVQKKSSFLKLTIVPTELVIFKMIVRVCSGKQELSYTLVGVSFRTAFQKTAYLMVNNKGLGSATPKPPFWFAYWLCDPGQYLSPLSLHFFFTPSKWE